jgi:hypothetical protein
MHNVIIFIFGDLMLIQLTNNEATPDLLNLGAHTL